MTTAIQETQTLHSFYDREEELILRDTHFHENHIDLLKALEKGQIRAATPQEDGSWEVCAWVKRAILLGFKAGAIERIQGSPSPFFDKDTYPLRWFHAGEKVRLVPGGSAVRRGAYVSPGVVVMPPAYINVGAYVGERTMVDSHALVGSCAQIGSDVHLSAGAQIGGVLEPAGAKPVIVEDGAFIGGLVGLFEGVHVRARAVIGSGVCLTRSTPIIDLVNDCEYRGEVPEGAVVLPGSKPFGNGTVQLAAAVIVKFRDEKTAASVALEEALR